MTNSTLAGCHAEFPSTRLTGLCKGCYPTFEALRIRTLASWKDKGLEDRNLRTSFQQLLAGQQRLTSYPQANTKDAPMPPGSCASTALTFEQGFQKATDS